MFTRYCCTIIILFLTASCYGQNKDNSFWKEKNTALRWNPASLIDPVETNFSAGIERRLNKRWGAGLDIGYIFYSTYYQNINKASGIIARPAIRYYINTKARSYVEAELHYKNSHSQIKDWLQKDIVNGVATYEQYQDFTMVKKVYGINIKMGGRGRLTKDDRLWIEGYFGLGLKYRKETVLNEPNSRYGISSNFSIVDGSTNPNAPLLSLPFGLRLLLKL